jgi:hypothetical protein
MKNISTLLRRLLCGLVACSTPAFASLIYVPGTQVPGTGLGAVQTVVTVQDNGGPQQNGTESGCVTYVPPASNADTPAQNCLSTLEGGDNTAGNAGNNTYLLTSIDGLSAAGNLAFVVNISEGAPGNTATLTDLYLALFNVVTGTTLAIFTYDGADLVLGDSGGVGQSGDNLFVLDSAQAAQANLACPILADCVVGGGIQFANGTTEATPETVYVASVQRPPVNVPEPVTIGLIGIGLLAMQARRKLNAANRK